MTYKWFNCRLFYILKKQVVKAFGATRAMVENGKFAGDSAVNRNRERGY